VLLANSTNIVIDAVLEPGNIERLKRGERIEREAHGVTLRISYTPDILYTVDQIRQGKSLEEAVQASQGRPEVLNRPTHEVEDLRKYLKNESE
jgi:hypothetical protein